MVDNIEELVWKVLAVIMALWLHFFKESLSFKDTFLNTYGRNCMST